MSYLIVWLNHLGEYLCHWVVHIRMVERVKPGAKGGGGVRGVCGERRQTKIKCRCKIKIIKHRSLVLYSLLSWTYIKRALNCDPGLLWAEAVSPGHARLKVAWKEAVAGIVPDSISTGASDGDRCSAGTTTDIAI